MVLAGSAPAWAQAGARLQGDIGVGLFRTPAITRAVVAADAVLPYVYADDGPWYARVDTFGCKIAALGTGHLELAMRVSFEGYRPLNPAFSQRSTPVPIGFGTFQETGLGAFILYALGDPVSGGTLLDGSYAAELVAGPIHIYPQVGIERRSARYVRHLYGINSDEAARSGTSTYAGATSVSPNTAISVEYELASSLKLTAQIRRRWLDTSIAGSPLVVARTQTTSLLALTRSFR